MGGGGIEIYRLDGPTVIANSTISGNTAANTGGAMYGLAEAPVSILQSTIAGNTAGATGGLHLNDADTTITGTIIGDNHDDGGDDAAATDLDTRVHRLARAEGRRQPEERARQGRRGRCRERDSTSTLTQSLVEGLVGDTVGLTDGGGNVRGADPVLGALAENGGPTRTQALLPGSPAIDAGRIPVPDFPGNGNDQRGPGYAAGRRGARRHRCVRGPGDRGHAPLHRLMPRADRGAGAQTRSSSSILIALPRRTL